MVPDPARILTHCNAGGLATAGYGTAIGVIRAAAEAGKRIKVWVDETRPLLQGARLTAWELTRAGIPATLITDNMAGHFMQRGEVDLVVVGADRIARNGDAANKIGTYGVAVLARAHGIPFYVAAPISTLDLSLNSGRDPDRGAGPDRGHRDRRAPPGAGWHAGGQSGLRRHAGQLSRRHHHRAGHRPRPVRREPPAPRRRGIALRRHVHPSARYSMEPAGARMRGRFMLAIVLLLLLGQADAGEVASLSLKRFFKPRPSGRRPGIFPARRRCSVWMRTPFPAGLQRQVDLLLGILLAHQGRCEEAIPRLEGAAATYPLLADYALYHLAEAQRRLGAATSPPRPCADSWISSRESVFSSGPAASFPESSWRRGIDAGG